MGAIGGFCHLYTGQEAIVVGMQMALKKGDQVITGYRDHGHMLATGMEARGVMAELTGRHGGYSKGKGGSMHMFSKEKNFFGGHGLVGAPVPLGTGLSFAQPHRGHHFFRLAYFRYRGHSMSDPAKYRTREEVDKVRHDQDPIEQVRNRLLAAKMSEQELKAIDAEVREIVNAAADFAQHDPEPDPSELYTDIYR